MSTLWVTSDTHFSHRMLALDIRGFPSIEEHDEYLIEKWNKTVDPSDTVIHLGDVSLKAPAVYAPLTTRLNGKKHLVYGNHDMGWGGHRDCLKYYDDYRKAGFLTTHEYLRRKIDGNQVLFSHFPYQRDHSAQERYTQYRFRIGELPIVHGHTHSSEKVSHAHNGRGVFGRGKTLQIHVGMEAWNLRPVSIDEIVEILRQEG